MTLSRRLLLVSGVVSVSCLRAAQEEAANFFSGYVVDLAADKVSVERTVLGHPPEKRSFILTGKTGVEGKLQMKARVTVQFTPSDQGDVAVHIIVRTGK